MVTPDHPEATFYPILAPLARVGEPEEVAALAHFLAAPDCAYITGQAICIDGGVTAGLAEHTLEAMVAGGTR